LEGFMTWEYGREGWKVPFRTGGQPCIQIRKYPHRFKLSPRILPPYLLQKGENDRARLTGAPGHFNAGANSGDGKVAHPTPPHFLNGCRHHGDPDPGLHQTHGSVKFSALLDDPRGKTRLVAQSHHLPVKAWGKLRRKKDKGLLFQGPQAHGSRRIQSQGMTTREGDHQVLLHHRLKVKVRIRLWLTNKPHIQRPTSKPFELETSGELTKFQAHVGMKRSIRPNPGWEGMKHDRGGKSYYQATPLSPGRSNGVSQQAIHAGKKGTQPGMQGASRIRELHPPPGTVQKPVPKAILQPLNRKGEGGLAEPKTFSCTPEMEFLRHHPERAKVSELNT